MSLKSLDIHIAPEKHVVFLHSSVKLVVLQEEFIFYERGTKEEMVLYMLLISMLSSHRSINKHLTQCLNLEHTTHNYFKIFLDEQQWD